ncbi:MAG: cation-translocating P-type ATPase [Pseudomonadota bacterium]
MSVVSADTPEIASEQWHRLPADEVVRRWQTDPAYGLGRDQVTKRQAEYGPNELPAKPRKGSLAIVLGQFRDLMILILIAAAVISGVVGDLEDTVAIVVIVLLNALIGAIQEYRAERAIAALRMMVAEEAKVLRDGETLLVNAAELVPGDIVYLDAGMVAPADIRLLELAELQADESVLTGESVAVNKQLDPVMGESLLPGERTNMVFKGTQLTRGRATGVVVATAGDTELGSIASLLEGKADSKTPLQQRLARFSSRLALFVLAICAVIFITGVLRGEPLTLMFLTAVSLAVAAIPEALPAVVTIALAFGARKMSRHKALIRHLPSVETLGSVTVICSDKTGTLTENRMHLEAVHTGDHTIRDPASVAADEKSIPKTLWQALALSNDVEASPGSDSGVLGDPTEIALYQAAMRAGYDKTTLSEVLPRVAELPFDAERKRMSTLHRQGAGYIAFTKGAPEQVLPLCSGRQQGEFKREQLLQEAEALAEEGYRVLAVASRQWAQPPEPLQEQALESELLFLGLIALIDPPREEAFAAVRECNTAGIAPVMITGDHPSTALVIARRLGIAEEGSEVITGSELNRLSSQQLAQRLEHVAVFARVSPEQKIKLVRAMQQKGEFVAMTGDGVNDAPALKQADIGVAMGLKGTDVAREAADMVLLDDNFATIVTAVREGRRIFDNIRKFIKDTMSSNSGEIWTLFLAPFLGLPVPLLPIHILWINLVTDGLPGLAFTQEPAEKGVMQRPPRPPGESIFAHGMWQHIIWVGLFVGGISIASQAWAISRGVEYWQTITFTVLTISQLFHSLSVRSEQQSLFSIGVFSNLYMLGAVLLMVVLQLMVIYHPLLNPIFKTQPLPLFDLGVCFALSSLVLVAVELEKWLIRRGWLYREESYT